MCKLHAHFIYYMHVCTVSQGPAVSEDLSLKRNEAYFAVIPL